MKRVVTLLSIFAIFMVVGCKKTVEIPNEVDSKLNAISNIAKNELSKFFEPGSKKIANSKNENIEIIKLKENFDPLVNGAKKLTSYFVSKKSAKGSIDEIVVLVNTKVIDNAKAFDEELESIIREENNSFNGIEIHKNLKNEYLYENQYTNGVISKTLKLEETQSTAIGENYGGSTCTQTYLVAYSGGIEIWRILLYTTCSGGAGGGTGCEQTRNINDPKNPISQKCPGTGGGGGGTSSTMTAAQVNQVLNEMLPIDGDYDITTNKTINVFAYNSYYDVTASFLSANVPYFKVTHTAYFSVKKNPNGIINVICSGISNQLNKTFPSGLDIAFDVDYTDNSIPNPTVSFNDTNHPYIDVIKTGNVRAFCKILNFTTMSSSKDTKGTLNVQFQ